MEIQRHVVLVLSVTLLFLSLFPPPSLFAGSVTLTWDPPTTNIDGSPLTNLAGFRVYYGNASKSYTQKIDVGNVTTKSLVLSDGSTHYFAVTAYDKTGYESTYSNEVMKSFPVLSPSACTLTVTKSGTGSGTVTSSPAGITCGTDCSELYTQGKVVTLTAAASAGSTFSGWSGGGCSGMGQCVTTVNSNTTLIGTFAFQTVSQPVSAPSGTYSFAWNMDHPSGDLVAYTGGRTRTGAMSGGTISPVYGQRGDGVRFTAADQFATWSVTGTEVSGSEATVWLSVFRNGTPGGHQLVEIYSGSSQIVKAAIANAGGNIWFRHLGNGSALGVFSSNVIPNAAWTRVGISWSASQNKVAVKIGGNAWQVQSGVVNPPLSSPNTFTVGEKSANSSSASTVYIDNVYVQPGFMNTDPY